MLRSRRLTLLAAVVGMALLTPVAATAGPAGARGRPLGSRGIRASAPPEQARNQHPKQPLPDGVRRLSPLQRARALTRLRARSGKSQTSLERGFERYRSVVTRVRQTARRHPDAVRVTSMGKSNGLRVQRVDLVGDRPLRRRPRVLIVGGVHAGSEIVGTEVATRFIEAAARDPVLRNELDITVIPLLNPSALVLRSRKNADGVDVNRSFEDGKWTAESEMVRRLAETESFDMILDLHAADHPRTRGFFVIRHGDDQGMSNRILSSLPTGWLNDLPGATGAPQKSGPYLFDNLGSARSENAGTLKSFFASRGTRYSYTIESPTRLRPDRQVIGMSRLLHSALRNLREHGEW